MFYLFLIDSSHNICKLYSYYFLLLSYHFQLSLNKKWKFIKMLIKAIYSRRIYVLRFCNIVFTFACLPLRNKQKDANIKLFQFPVSANETNYFITYNFIDLNRFWSLYVLIIIFLRRITLDNSKVKLGPICFINMVKTGSIDSIVR